MNRYDLLIFDLDGTILDTLEDLADSLNYVLEKYGFGGRTLSEVRRFVGNGIRNLIARGAGEELDGETAERMFADFSAHYKEHCRDKTRPYDGIKELLCDLRKDGGKTAVVSNKADFAVKELIGEYFPEAFDLAVGEREGIKRKPAPDTVNEVLEKLGADRSRAVYIGDSEVDVKTAENAGLALIAVSWGFRDREVLEKAGASVIARTPEELRRLLTDAG